MKLLRQSVNPDGYGVVGSRKHKRLLVHRLVRLALRAEIPDGWVVHHCDGKRTSNRPGNLLAMPARIHRLYHVQVHQAFLEALDGQKVQWAELKLFDAAFA